jgi:hypothetical protein
LGPDLRIVRGQGLLAKPLNPTPMLPIDGAIHDAQHYGKEVWELDARV